MKRSFLKIYFLITKFNIILRIFILINLKKFNLIRKIKFTFFIINLNIQEN